MPLLVQATASTVVSQRETSVFILTVLLDKGATEFDEQVGEFFKLFSSLLQDPESLEVRILSVKYEPFQNLFFVLMLMLIFP